MRIDLPHIGESVTEAIIGKWLKQVGDRVEKYESLVEIVTDKVSMEVPSPAAGFISKITVAEGQTVPMGAMICEIEIEPGQELRSSSDRGNIEGETVDRIGTLLRDVDPVGPTGSGIPVSDTNQDDRFVRHSPAVVKLASTYNVDLSQIIGTGSNGRITRKDVQQYVANNNLVPQSHDSEELIPLTPVRRMIADGMTRSTREIPEAWTVIEVDVSGLVNLREKTKADFLNKHAFKLTYMPFVLRVVANCLKANPLLNSSWRDDSIALKKEVNIGIAISTPRGLVVPVLHSVDSLTMIELASKINNLTDKARSNSLALEDVQKGTFTVNNTGTLGSVMGKAIINHPQAAILNIESIVKRPIVIEDSVVVRSITNLCLTFDHRILDGLDASNFLADVKIGLEEFSANSEMEF